MFQSVQKLSIVRTSCSSTQHINKFNLVTLQSVQKLSIVRASCSSTQRINKFNLVTLQSVQKFSLVCTPRSHLSTLVASFPWLVSLVALLSVL